MYLNEASLTADRAGYAAAGISLPQYDRAAMIARTTAEPTWLHFGAGNLFRAFPAKVCDQLLSEGILDHGVIAAEGFDLQIIDDIYAPHDNLSLSVTLLADGTVDKQVIGAVAEAVGTDARGIARLSEIFCAPSLQMVSFTITEKGYAIHRPDGSIAPAVASDMSGTPDAAGTFLARLTALLHKRYLAGAYPLALVSMDNCSHNGDKLRAAVFTIAQAWAEHGAVSADFPAYLSDESRITFPISMIDKITPRPDTNVAKMLTEVGFADTETVITDKNTYIAPFVNAEKPQYLVIEDKVPAGRPALDAGGVIFTERTTVDKTEKMKVCTCLNPLHTALAVYGCLLGYTLISAEMKDPELSAMVHVIGYKEGLPVVVDPGILDPQAFIDEVVGVRLPNPFMPDAPQRIATDTSQKMAVRFGETIKAYLANNMDVTSLRAIPLVIAGWCRYLMGVDDNGEAFSVSPDPLLSELQQHLAGLTLGHTCPECVHRALAPILSNASIFAVDLYQAGLGETVEALFLALTEGPGAVRAVLRKTFSA
ncbi:MAG: mannitol dehydrogenase family protein [Clostridia bacterium]|nr:mannitol dehydrogenase family protein [Clostridia bacterium]